MHPSPNPVLWGINRLLDIDNGGVLDNGTSVVPSIVVRALFFNDLPPLISCPTHVVLKIGSVLSIPEPGESFDGVLVAKLLHHLVGAIAKASAPQSVFKRFTRCGLIR